MLAFALILTYPLKLLSVQSDSERRVVLEGSTGTAHYGGANVPNVQTKCPAGCYRLHSTGYDNNHAPAITSAKVSFSTLSSTASLRSFYHETTTNFIIVHPGTPVLVYGLHVGSWSYFCLTCCC